MKSLNNLALSIISILIFVGILYVVISALPLWSIKEIIILENDRIPESSIIEASGIKIGSHLLRVSSYRINKNITTKFKEIKEIEIRKKFPDKILIKVVLRKPIISIYTRNNLVYFDENAIPVKYSNKTQVPLLVNKPNDHQELLNKISSFSPFLKTLANYLPEKNIAIYQITSSNIRFTIENTQIKFGGINNYKKKLQLLGILIDSVDLAELEYIDIRVPNNIAVMRRK